MDRIVYSVRKNRLKYSGGIGFFADENASLIFDEHEPEHRIYLKSIDAAEDDAEWGRLSFRMQIGEEQVIYIYAVASNDATMEIGQEVVDINRFLTASAIPDSSKMVFLQQPGALRFVGKNDVLLYGLKGRYLYLCIEVMGEGSGYLAGIKVERGSDEFMEAFPAIYSEGNDFFRRFITVYNSIYNDFEDKISLLPHLLDLDKCPDFLLPMYAGWLGIDVQGDFIMPEALRTLVKEAYTLNRMKGTKACLKRVLEIAVDEPCLVLEANRMHEYADAKAVNEGLFDITVLVKKQLTETERYQLSYLLEQFIPVRCRLKLESFKDSGILDTRVYMDMNAQVADMDLASLDSYIGMDGYVVLEE